MCLNTNVIYVMLSLLWICIILGLSCIPGELSSKLSKGAISKSGKKIFNIADTKWLHYYIRRSCHPIEFFVLEILLTFSFSEQIRIQPYAVFIAVVIAVFDEFVKLFIKGRHFSFEDIILDLVGIAIAVIVIYCIEEAVYEI